MAQLKQLEKGVGALWMHKYDMIDGEILHIISVFVYFRGCRRTL